MGGLPVWPEHLAAEPGGGGSTARRLDALENQMFLLLEELRFLLANLGAENFNRSELEGLKAELTEAVQLRLGTVEAALERSGLRVRVENAEGGLSRLEQTAARIHWLVQGEDAASFTLTQRMAWLSAQGIDLSGYVTFHSLADDGQTTTIHGGALHSPTITGDSIRAAGAFQAGELQGGAFVPWGYVGKATGLAVDGGGNATATCGVALAASGETDSSGAVSIHTESPYVIVTEAGARMSFGDAAVFVAPSGAKQTVYFRSTDTEAVTLEALLQGAGGGNSGLLRLHKNVRFLQSSCTGVAAYNDTTLYSLTAYIPGVTTGMMAVIAPTTNLTTRYFLRPECSTGNGLVRCYVGAQPTADLIMPYVLLIGLPPEPVEGLLTLSRETLELQAGGGDTVAVRVNNSAGAVHAVSSDPGVAAVAASGGTVTVTGIAAGTALVTVTTPATAYYTAGQAVCRVTVR